MTHKQHFRDLRQKLAALTVEGDPTHGVATITRVEEILREYLGNIGHDEAVALAVATEERLWRDTFGDPRESPATGPMSHVGPVGLDLPKGPAV
jgi:hypothetical protein